MRRIQVIATLASLVCATGVYFAQTTQPPSATIRGVVLDPSGALIPGVQVTLTNSETREVKRLVSGPRGEYSIEASAGTYELKAELPGFKTSVIQAIRLSEKEFLKVDIHMYVDVPAQR